MGDGRPSISLTSPRNLYSTPAPTRFSRRRWLYPINFFSVIFWRIVNSLAWLAPFSKLQSAVAATQLPSSAASTYSCKIFDSGAKITKKCQIWRRGAQYLFWILKIFLTFYINPPFELFFDSLCSVCQFVKCHILPLFPLIYRYKLP